jgi:methylmalonyl-CoA mutase cobalamin-binding subunit
LLAEADLAEANCVFPSFTSRELPVERQDPLAGCLSIRREPLAAPAPWGEKGRKPRPPVLPLARFVEALLGEDTACLLALSERALVQTGGLHGFGETYLAPAARLLGDLWLADETDFLTVTIAVARLERLFRRLAAEQGNTASPSRERRILLAPAPGNQHSFGLALVEERFREAGWKVDCCSAGDGGAIVTRAAAHAYDVIGLSVCSGSPLAELAAILARLRVVSRNRSVRLLGGGSAMAVDAAGIRAAGFDGLAEDAASAVRQAEAPLISAPTAVRFRAAAE